MRVGHPTPRERAADHMLTAITFLLMCAPLTCDGGRPADHDAAKKIRTRGGDDRPPDWYRNVQAHPDVELVIAGRRRHAHARIASPQERAQLWPQITKAYQGYANYQTRTTREIPVVICDLDPQR